MNNINERIKAIINEMFMGKMSQFAISIQANKNTIQNYIKENPSKPNSDFLAAIVLQLHVDAHWLLTGEGNMMQDANVIRYDHNPDSAMYSNFNIDLTNSGDKKILGRDGISISSSDKDLSKIIDEKDKQIGKLLAMLEDKDKLIAKLIDKN